MPSGNIVSINGVSCTGTLGSVTVQATGGTGSGYQYSIDNGVTWQASGSFSGLAAGAYVITVQDGNGCQGGIPVTISPAGTSQPVNAGPDQTVCQGIAVILTGSGVQSYSWNNGVTNGTPFVPTGTQTYVVTGTDINGCTATDTVLVTVNPAPNVQAGPDRIICAGDALILIATGASTYTWNNGVTNGVSFAPTSTQTYTVIGTDALGCQATNQVQVTVNPLPSIIAGADQTACQGNNVTLSGSGGVSYVWNNGVVDGTPFIPGSTQTFTVTGTDANGCQNSDQVTVTVVPFPTADISSDVVEGYPTLTVNFTNNSTNATSYQWNFGNGSTNTASNTAGQQAQYPNPGDYVVILTASNGGCTDKDTINIHVFQFLEPTFVLPNIITPNGDNNNDFFFINVTNVKNVKVTIVNRWGNKVAQYEGVNGFWDGTINGSPAVEGDYFVNYEIVDLYDNSIKGQGFVQVIK
jgi:gliding motility-associated-like protein